MRGKWVVESLCFFYERRNGELRFFMVRVVKFWLEFDVFWFDVFFIYLECFYYEFIIFIKVLEYGDLGRVCVLV